MADVWNDVQVPPTPSNSPSVVAKESCSLQGGSFKSMLGRLSGTLTGSDKPCSQWRCVLWLVIIIGLMTWILVLASVNLEKPALKFNWVSIVLVCLLMIGGGGALFMTVNPNARFKRQL